MADVNPRIMSRLIFLEKVQIFAVNLKSAVLTKEPFFLGVRKLDEPAHIGPCTGSAAKAPKRMYWESRDFERFLKCAVVVLVGSHFCGASLHR